VTRSTFKMEDVTRFAKALTKAGVSIGRAELTPEGKIVVIPRDQSEAARRRDDEAEEGRNEWDPL
jgi:hypothetical protein